MPPVAGLLVLALTASEVRAQGALPDLVADIAEHLVPIEVQRNATVPAEDVAEGCAAATGGRTLVRFTLTTLNQGSADVVLGDPGCDCTVDPPPPCTNPLFVCSVANGHGHAHFERYARYELLSAADTPVVAAGRKQGFCIEDTLCSPRTYTCDYQGLRVGCTDAYFNFLGCQYVDATGLPGGRYLLRASVNYDRIIPESRYDNNVAEAFVELCDALEAPTLRLRGGANGRTRWVARGRVAYAVPPLHPTDPLAEGALVRLVSGVTSLIEVAVPPGRRGSGCQAKDGWRGLPNGARRAYRNLSGYLDAGCSVSAGGLERLVVVLTERGFTWVARGARAAAVDPPESVTATLALSQATGPCGASRLARCEARGGRDRTVCVASASGAFVD
jgi:hypothetical protein